MALKKDALHNLDFQEETIMAIQRYVVSNDRSVYESWPDLLLTEKGKLICVFCECTHHGDRSYSRIMYAESFDRGQTWQPKKPMTEAIRSEGIEHWDCPRMSHLKDGRLAVTCNRVVIRDGKPRGEIFLWFGDSEGEHWTEPFSTGFEGIVPDRLLETRSGRWIISCHTGHINGLDKLQQRLWYSDDQGKTWSEPVMIGSDPRYNLCEGYILEVEPGTLVCFMRENSSEGYECIVSKSLDDGLTWSPLYTIPLACCHRPTAGILDTGEIMITYRYRQGAKKGWLGYWTQNTFLAVSDKETVLTGDKEKQWVRIMPLDYDTSPESALGYTGWVQFDDGLIYVVDYIKNQEEKCYIIGDALTRADIGGI